MRKRLAAVAGLALLPALGSPPVHAQGPSAGDLASDTIAPSIAIDAPPPVTGSWYDRPVTITVSADDDEFVASLAWQLSGAQIGAGSQAGGDAVGIPVSAEGVTAIDLTAKDTAGNVTTRRWWVSVDLSAPTVTANLVEGAQITWGTARTWFFDCSDAGIGLESCTSSLARGQALPTDTLGEKVLTVAAADKVGHQRYETIHYTVMPAPFALDEAVSVVGIPFTGNPLTATPGQWTPAPDTRAYQWMRGGAEIVDATGPTYRLTPADVGKQIWVRETVSRANYATSVSTSAPVLAAAARLALVQEATVTGTSVIGQRLVVTPPKFDSTPDQVVLSWLRDDRPVATGTSYAVTAADAGHRLTMEYRASRAGFTDVVHRLEVGRVARLVSRTTASVVTTRSLARVTVRVSASGAVPTGTVTVLRKGRVVATRALARGTARLRVPRKQARQTLLIRYAGSAQVAPSQTTVRIPAR